MDVISIKNKQNFTYRTSSFISFFGMIAITVGVAILLKIYFSWSLSLTGSWTNCISYIMIGWMWMNPSPLIAWSGAGIDHHPNDKNTILIGSEYKNHSLFVQPNRLKFSIGIAIISSGALLKALGQTFAI